MEFSRNPLQWSAQFGPSLTNSFDQRRFIDKETKNPEDPGFGTDDRPRCDFRASMHLRGSDAKAIYKRAISSAGAPYLCNIRYPNMVCTRTGDLPKNQLNENVKRLRRIMRETQKRHKEKEEKSKPIPAKELWQSKQYNHVQSKVKQRLQEDDERPRSRPQSAQGRFLRAHENTGPKVLRSQSVNAVRPEQTNSSDNLAKTAPIDNKTKANFVKINSDYVTTLPKTRKAVSAEAVEESREKQEKRLQKYHEKQKGRVPNYIEKMKEKRDQDMDEAFANTPDPECPRGHIKLDNQQRQSKLQELRSTRSDLEQKLHQLPLRNDSLKIRQTKEAIEKKLVELDEAIEIFSKPKVFVNTNE
ncbi:unnamed protein product [Adineta ricciae]|uniref:Enkurin domain-containing protein n=1 Tax=Adineta ricciae TaxID=249248 RepID=A0A814K8F4_ADIRI|nr:unnamed protein product [Adineta ricciae]